MITRSGAANEIAPTVATSAATRMENGSPLNGRRIAASTRKAVPIGKRRQESARTMRVRIFFKTSAYYHERHVIVSSLCTITLLWITVYLSQWLAQNWFELVQTAGIIEGFVLTAEARRICRIGRTAKDVRDFLAPRIPKVIRDKPKPLQDETFVLFIESCIEFEP